MNEGLEILPKTVRDILKIDNNEIVRLCQAGNLPLRQNSKGLTYFTTDDVKILKKMQDLQNTAQEKEIKAIQLKNGLKKTPAKKSEPVKQHIKTTVKPSAQSSSQLPAPVKKDETVALLKQITGAVKNIETGFYDKFALVLEEKLENKLEEKLGGIDKVILDLVSSKTEAEELRRKLAESSKEIFALKNELSCYKKMVGNIYIRKEKEEVFDI